ncbi:substrate-binding domain-containing protein [Streptomyces sp. ISL-99]|uniref:substrate-binding domain-containing protein n=1 Tax=Streptomyces sp. ISL-99 TaxID=2819193 RepID=UPI0027E45384|nr:substrate-binding domain-containing protein [Streptomyces sp. ISL-99]
MRNPQPQLACGLVDSERALQAVAVATTARAHRYDVLLLTGEEGPDAVRRVAGSGLADAIILMDVELDDDRLPLLRGTDQPSVLIGLPADTSGLTCVDLAFKATGALCVEHLAMLGHRDIAVIGESPAVYERHTGFAERTLDGLRCRARELGVRVLHRRARSATTRWAVTLARILDERPGTSRPVVQNEQAVEPLLALLHRQGHAVPEDVSVVAVCPEQVAVQASMRLTSVSIPAQEMGRHAEERLVAKLEGCGTDDVVLIAPEWTVRTSTGSTPPAAS